MWTLILIESLIWKATITKIFGQTNAGVVGVVGGFEKVHCLSQSFWFDLAPPEKKKAVDIQRLSFILNWRRDSPPKHNPTHHNKNHSDKKYYFINIILNIYLPELTRQISEPAAIISMGYSMG